MTNDRTKTDAMYPGPVFERDEYIRSRDYEKLFDWAFKYDDSSMSKEILEDVAEAYEILMDNGYGMAANNLGSMYYCGRGFRRNVSKAMECYELAMKDGINLAWGNMGCCYYFDKKDYGKAYEVFSEGAYLFNDVECLYMLGDMYRYGLHVEQSDVKAYHLYQKALNAVNEEDRRDYCLKGDVFCRMGELQIAKADTKNAAVDGLKKVYIGVGILYERYTENRFVDDDIRKYRNLIRETENVLRVPVQCQEQSNYGIDC